MDTERNRTATSLYQRLAGDLKAAIADGVYGDGARLPSESDLAREYGVSRGTVRQAFAALRAEGVIASRRGARRVVLGGRKLQNFTDLVSFSRWARSLGETPSGRIVSLERRPASQEERERLALEDGAQIYYLVRVRLLSDRPVMIERSAFPDRVGALVAGMENDVQSITDRLEELGVIFADAEHVIDAVPATAADARLLGINPRVPLLRERRHTTDQAGVPVEWSEDRYLGDAVAFTVHNSLAANALAKTHRQPPTHR
ncbi:MAG TPA: GntR family transcriptional regulator [Pseudonocardiaceae bacterium]